ncbi:MAG TPA: hypothetical protein VGL57_15485 [Solirubrobacteraceae bacterium]|jgi:hypothetical protein
MKTIKMLGLTVVAMLALGGLSASAATAYEWQINGAALVKPAAAHWTSTIKFENTAEAYSFSCTIAHKGTLGTGASGEITSITSSGGAKAIPCELTHGSSDCTSAMEIEALGLPWATELATVGGELRNKIAGSPEWKVRCKGVGGEARTNWCVVSPNAGPHNVTGGVEEIYDSNSPHTTCLDDGGNPFVTRGIEFLSPEGGGTLSVAPAPVEWQLGGAGLAEPLVAGWKGKMKLTDAEETVECEDTATGMVGLAGAGEITKWTTANCSGGIGKTACETPPVVEALNLPWHTELVTVAGVIRDVMVNSGKGVPGYQTNCKFLGIHVTDQCTGVVDFATTNAASGVTATFNASEKLNCTKSGAGKGVLEGAQTIEATGGGKLEVK